MFGFNEKHTAPEQEFGIPVMETECAKLPDAPSISQVGKALKEGLAANPDQAAQIATCLSVLKRAGEEDSYESYVALAASLDVDPVSPEAWAKKDKTALIQLVRASIVKNIPGIKVTDEKIDELLAGARLPSKTQAALAMTKTLLEILGATKSQIAPWTKLMLVALRLVVK